MSLKTKMYLTNHRLPARGLTSTDKDHDNHEFWGALLAGHELDDGATTDGKVDFGLNSSPKTCVGIPSP
jgi:hypothetical protein